MPIVGHLEDSREERDEVEVGRIFSLPVEQARFRKAERLKVKVFGEGRIIYNVSKETRICTREGLASTGRSPETSASMRKFS